MSDHERRTALVVITLVSLLAVSAAAVLLTTRAEGAATWLPPAAAILVAVGGGVAARPFLRRTPPAVNLLICLLAGIVAFLAGAWTVASSVPDLEGPLPAARASVFLVTGAMAVVAAAVAFDQLRKTGAVLTSAAQRLRGRHREEVVTGTGRPLPDIADDVARLSQDLEASRRRERDLDAARRRLVLGISHDLRTPLNTLQAVLDAVEDRLGAPRETRQRYAGIVRQELDKLRTLVDGFLELSEIEGGLQLRTEHVPLGDLVSDAIAEASPVADRRGVRIRHDLTASPLVSVSPVHCNRILANLLENAVRYSPDGAIVRLETSTEGEHAVVRVDDSCGGVPAEELERLFEPVYRGSFRERSEGFGLGLAVASGLARAHGGSLSVRNHEGGCRFELALPLPVEAR
jgi:signal transduction histidine kinase